MAKKDESFLQGVRSEFKRVTWPSKEETIQYTVTVIVIALLVALLTWGLDFIFNWLIGLFV